jgi:hypothetical protein
MADIKRGEPSHVEPGGEVHGTGVGAHAVVLNHETSDIPLTGTTRAALFSAVGIGLVMVLMWGAWGFFLGQAKQVDPGKPPMSADDYGSRLPQTPRLQSVPEQDLSSYRAEQAAKLNELAWVDQGAGTVRLPIHAAMRLIVQRADAFADQRAKAPAEHSWSEPGAALLDASTAPATPAAAGHGAPAAGDHAAPAPAHTPAHGAPTAAPAHGPAAAPAPGAKPATPPAGAPH